MNKNEYVVLAGYDDRPMLVDRGVLEKGMGQSSRTELGQTINRRCDIGFPNRTEAWGMRVVRDENGEIIKEGRDVDVKDSAYRGEIVFLKYGNPKGQKIICRYLKGYSTIDYLYQNLVLNAEANLRDESEVSGDFYWLRLVSGDNVIDEMADPYLAQMIRVHAYNESSISKMPEATFSLFKDKIFGQVEEVGLKELSSKFDALKLVNEAATDNTYAKLRNLAIVVKSLVFEDIKEDNLLTSLSKLADTKPTEFVSAINEYKKNVSNVFEKAKAFEILDLTLDGVISAGQKTKKEIATDIPAKGEGMLEWCMAEFLDARAFEVAFQLKKITDKIK